MLDLLFSPIDTARAHDVGFAVSWHGRLMVLAWAVLLPLGVFAARFCKVLPGQNWPYEVQNPFWYTWHRILQYSGLVVAVLALILILSVARGRTGADLHQWFGWSVLVLALLQYLASLAKGTGGGPGPDGAPQGDHFKMTRRRKVFEWTHKFLGYIALAIAVVSIVSGLWLANGYVWMWIAIVLWWGALIVGFVGLQARGWTVDTYQAIWGTDPNHPGNQIKPIGWGIRRGPPVAFDQTISIKKTRMAERARRRSAKP